MNTYDKILKASCIVLSFCAMLYSFAAGAVFQDYFDARKKNKELEKEFEK